MSPLGPGHAEAPSHLWRCVSRENVTPLRSREEAEALDLPAPCQIVLALQSGTPEQLWHPGSCPGAKLQCCGPGVQVTRVWSEGPGPDGCSPSDLTGRWLRPGQTARSAEMGEEACPAHTV